MGRHERNLNSEHRSSGAAVVRLLSARLRRWRRSNAKPLKQVAADLGVSIAVVSAWERGSRFPSAFHLEKISAYTGIPVWQLFYQDAADEHREEPFPER